MKDVGFKISCPTCGVTFDVSERPRMAWPRSTASPCPYCGCCACATCRDPMFAVLAAEHERPFVDRVRAAQR